MYHSKKLKKFKGNMNITQNLIIYLSEVMIIYIYITQRAML